MGETQLYSQRLHGINEKRRILSEVERIQRELELQKLKLQQQKRKSLRDRWLMDGLVPAQGVETDNPLSQTEDKIRNLELELESYQLQLVHLENPELNIAKTKKVEGTNLHKELVNGDGNQRAADQKENHEHNTTIKEDKPLDSSRGEKPEMERQVLSQQEPAQGKDGLVGPPVPAPRGIKIPENNQVEHSLELPKSNELGANQTHQSQNQEHFDQKGEAGHHENLAQKEDDVMQNLNHCREDQDENAEHLDKDGEHQHQDQSLDQEHIDKNIDLHNQSSDKSLEHEQENLEHLTHESGHVNLGTEGHKLDISQPSLANEDLSKVSFNQHQNDNVKLLGEPTNSEILENQKENERSTQNDIHPTLPTAEDHDLPLRTGDHKNSQNVNEKDVSGSVIHDQNRDQTEEFVISLEKQEQHQNEKPPVTQDKADNPVVLLTGQDKDPDSTQPPEDSKQNPLLPFKDQNLDLISLPIYKDQCPILPTMAQEKTTTLPPNNQHPSASLPDEDNQQPGQVHISQVVVISAPGVNQHSAHPQPGPSASHQPGTVITNTPAECQPLLHKTQETDAHPHQHGSNTAETRDKDTPVKKKTCQCCVVM
ncbi:paralemmin-3 [Mixophyes fleayi]|uniref:paralemmin-3 n=1 Tax=Mixophyes fleayi TaxID=3061075 RepID=UPI003F4E215F